MTPTITSDPDAPESDVDRVRAGLLAFNEARIGPARRRTVQLFARDDAGQVVGGLLGVERWGWLYVDQLWVDEAHRGGDVGTALLARAEADALAAGCTDVMLDTFSFQARPFYEKHGYAVWGTLDGFPPGHAQHYLRKRLAPPGIDDSSTPV